MLLTTREEQDTCCALRKQRWLQNSLRPAARQMKLLAESESFLENIDPKSYCPDYYFTKVKWSFFFPFFLPDQCRVKWKHLLRWTLVSMTHNRLTHTLTQTHTLFHGSHLFLPHGQTLPTLNQHRCPFVPTTDDTSTVQEFASLVSKRGTKKIKKSLANFISAVNFKTHIRAVLQKCSVSSSIQSECWFFV